MEIPDNIADSSDGNSLNQLFLAHRLYLQNVYALLRLLESEVTKRGWVLVKNGGYGITRNGLGRGLANFAVADWVISQAGITFIRTGLAVESQGITTTQIPIGGLKLLGFQVRWLDKSPEEPSVWWLRLTVEREESASPKKWEDYQSNVFNRLETGTEQGRLKPAIVKLSGAAISFSGEYGSVPVTSLRSEADVLPSLIEPALDGWEG